MCWNLGFGPCLKLDYGLNFCAKLCFGLSMYLKFIVYFYLNLGLNPSSGKSPSL